MLSVIYAECCLYWVLFILSAVYAVCCLCWVSFMLSVTNKSNMLNAVMPSVIMLSVVAPLVHLWWGAAWSSTFKSLWLMDQHNFNFIRGRHWKGIWYVFTSFITFSEKSCYKFLFFAVNDRFCNFVIKGKLNTIDTSFNGTTHFKECKQLFEYQHLLLLRDIWWSKF